MKSEKIESKRVKVSIGDRIYMLIIYLLLIFAAFITLFPFMDVVFSSLASPKEIVETAKDVITIPKHPTLDNY